MDQPQPTIYVYGFREPEVQRIDPTQLARWLMGADVPIDAELAAAIRAEFNAQERYRRRLLDAVQTAVGKVLRQAMANVAPIEHPIADRHDAFWRGYALGKYEAFSTSAAALSEVSIVAALELEGPNDGRDTSPVGQP